jgi:hypothetical protein
MTDTIRAPWTPEQVAALNAFQQRGGMHPFTCGGEHSFSSPTLVAHPDGWHCPAEPCTYQQDWAHAFMADPAVWPRPFGDRHGPTLEEARALIASATLPASDLVDTLIARLEVEEANVRRLADLAQVPEVRYADGGVACGFRQAAILAVHHLRGPEARDAYIAATEGRERTAADNSRTTPDNPAASTDTADNLPQVGWYCWRCEAINTEPCKSDSVPVHVPADWADLMTEEIAKRDEEDDDEPAPAAFIINPHTGSGLSTGATSTEPGNDGEMNRLRGELARMQEAGDHHIGAAERELARAVERTNEQAAEVQRLGDWCRIWTERAETAETERDRFHDELAVNEADRVAAVQRAVQAEATIARVQAAITKSFMAGPNAVQAVRLSAVRAALDGAAQ